MFYINGRFLTQQITGVQRFALEICLQLKQLDNSIIILAPKNIIHEDICSKLGIEIIGKRTGYFWEQLELPLWVRKHGNNIPLLNPCNLAPLIYSNNILVLHDIAVLKNPKWFSKKFYWVYKILLPLTVFRAKKIFTVSEFSKNEIATYFKIRKNNIAVIYNGISDLNKSKNIFWNWGFNKNEYILGVSSLNPRKNFKTVIDAFIKLDKELHLVLVGEVNKAFANEEYEIPLNKKNKIHFLGYISDSELFNLYKNAYVFVYPSLYEGFGIPPLEAMKCGCPVIVSNSTSLPEVCQNGAVYIDPLDSSTLINAILLFKNEEIRSLQISKGYKVVEQYSWKDSALKIVDTLRLL